MSLPPPPGSFGSVPPNGGGGPSWGGQPQQPGQPYGAPYQGQPGGQWGPPQQWAGGPPPNKGGRGKWILIGLALVAVIAVSVVATVLVLRPESGGGGGSTPAAQNGNSEFASANDTGPANLITEDPTCAAWTRIAVGYTNKVKAVNWGQRKSDSPASSWDDQQRKIFETGAQAMNDAAGQTANLALQTPHRVMRELYQQFIVYAEYFSTKVKDYVPADHAIAGTVDGLVSGLAAICSAIDYNSVAPVAPLIPTPQSPDSVQAALPTAQVERFLASKDPICADWNTAVQDYFDETSAWNSTDPSIPASEWTPEQKSINDAAAPIMTSFADRFEQLGLKSDNLILRDMAVLSAQYRRATVQALPNYVAADNFLSEAATFLVKAVDAACQAAG
ncbi:hypothetical protein A5721_06170 [Mycobacterium vulneris]|nr:hypothetical protein A5721_06170 [Mycolicibacterium vulneris]